MIVIFSMQHEHITGCVIMVNAFIRFELTEFVVDKVVRFYERKSKNNK